MYARPQTNKQTYNQDDQSFISILIDKQLYNAKSIEMYHSGSVNTYPGSKEKLGQRRSYIASVVGMTLATNVGSTFIL